MSLDNVKATLTYTCGTGEVFDLMQTGVRVLSGDLHTWERSPVENELIYGSSITAVGKAAVTYTVQLILGGPAADREDFLNNLHRALEYDMAQNVPGTLRCGDWEIGAFGVSSATTPNSSNSKTLNTIGFFCPSPFWTKTDNLVVSEETASHAVDEDLDFAFDFEFDFTGAQSRMTEFTIESLIPSDFIMRIYGPIADPVVRINGHIYEVDIEIESNAYVEINSAKRTVIKKQRNGLDVNVFYARRKDISVFEQIPGGKIRVLRNGLYRVEIDVLRKRDEPEWS